MNLVADEGVDKPIVDHLRLLGHSVYYILEEKSGISDDKVLEIANKLKTVLITLDTDFGELIFRLMETTHGVLLLRIAGLPVHEKLGIVQNVIEKHSSELTGSFTVVTKEIIRIRKL